MTTICVIQARMGSTRLPGKVLMDLDGHTVLAWVIRACKSASLVDRVVVVTSTEKRDDAIKELCNRLVCPCIRGDENDVLGRFQLVAKCYPTDNVFIRITADEPFVDPVIINSVLHKREITNADYCSNVHPRTFPDGLDVECFTRKALNITYEKATRIIDRECVTSWMVRHPEYITTANVNSGYPDFKRERWVLDAPEDYTFCTQITTKWPWYKGPPNFFDILKILLDNPELRNINKHLGINERFLSALDDEIIDLKEKISNSLDAPKATENIDQLIQLRIEEHYRNHTKQFQ